MNKKEPLCKMLERNRRCVLGNRDGATTSWDPEAMLSGKEPFAAVLGCPDSRVPPEQIFDPDHDDCGAVKAGLQCETSEPVGDLIWHVPLAVAHVLVGEKAFHKVEGGELALAGMQFSLDSGEGSVLKVRGEGLEE